MRSRFWCGDGRRQRSGASSEPPSSESGAARGAFARGGWLRCCIARALEQVAGLFGKVTRKVHGVAGGGKKLKGSARKQKKAVTAAEDIDSDSKSKLRINFESLLIDLNEEMLCISEEMASVYESNAAESDVLILN